MRKIIASLDIGSSGVKLIVGEFIKNSLNVLCASEVQSKGIKKGLISSINDLIPVLKEVFHKSEEMLGLPIKEVVLAVPAYYTEVVSSVGSSTITNEDKVIGHQDLIRAMQGASYNKIDESLDLISIIPTRYKINDDEIVKNPINMIGNKLTVKAVLITVPKAIINNGGETTTVSIFNKGILMKSEVIELGGTSIDNDIAYIYKITKKDARDLKINLGLATPDMANLNERVSITDRLGDTIVINQKDLSEIIESRLEEILELSKKQINLLTKKNIDYVVVTGGTTELGDFNILLDKVFTKSHILGKIDIVGVRNNKFSTSIGTIKYYNGRLKLKNKEYSVFNLDELEVLSGNHKKININENSILGKLFGYFFDN